jgi:hypothetical protein
MLSLEISIQVSFVIFRSYILQLSLTLMFAKEINLLLGMKILLAQFGSILGDWRAGE